MLGIDHGTRLGGWASFEFIISKLGGGRVSQPTNKWHEAQALT